MGGETCVRHKLISLKFLQLAAMFLMPSSVTFNIAHTAISPWSSRGNDMRAGVTETLAFIQQVHNIQSNDVWRNIDKCRLEPFATTTAI
jgi:hypothetical protein